MNAAPTRNAGVGPYLDHELAQWLNLRRDSASSRMMANHAKARTCAQFRCALAMGIPHSDCMIKIPTLRIVRPLTASWTTPGPQGERCGPRHMSAAN